MNRYLVSFGCIALAMQPLFAQSVISTDFFDGIPSDFTMEDRDGNIISSDVKSYGFDQGDAWVAYFIESEKNMVAASTSWYASPGTSDDWMILPIYSVSNGDVLQWNARSSDKYLPNAYKVVAICNGEETVIFSSEGEQASWTYHNIPLDDFAGKDVKFAFVDCSTDASLLYIDNIRLAKTECLRAEITTPSFVTGNTNYAITGILYTDIADSIEGNVKVRSTVGGVVQTLDLGNIKVNPNSEIPFTMPQQSTAKSYDEKEDIQISILLNDEVVYESVKEISYVVNYAVCEEITGTWCAWCVRGIGTFKHLTELYPDSFIGIAIHDRDVMSEGVEEYENYIYSYGHASGLPFGYMMRNSLYGTQFDKFEESVSQITSKSLTAYVETTIGDASDSSYPLTTAVTLTESMTDDRYQVAYVLIEDDVYDPSNSDKYFQMNAYAGGEYGECYGFEDMPSMITDMRFEHVARAYVGDYKGIFASLPMYMKADNIYYSDNDITIPATVLDINKCKVVTLLIDKKTANIVAADITPFAGSSKVDNIYSNDEIRILDRVMIIPEGNYQVLVTDISGRIVYRSIGMKSVDLSHLSQGIYVVHLSNANRSSGKTIRL